MLGGVGRLLVACGVLLLLFTAYLLWGTGLSEASHQRALQSEFDRALAARSPGPAPPGSTSSTSTPDSTSSLPPGLVQELSAGVAPAEGQPVALLQIPKLNLQKVVVEGTDESDLRLGPGHYDGTPLPGQPGNVGIAGHRTTYGAPFYDLDELHAGDTVDLTTLQGHFVYRVTGSEIVSPEDVGVLQATSTPTLTLTTCNPRFSASQRLVVHADLVSSVAPVPPAVTEPSVPAVHARSEALAGSTGGWSAPLWWAAITLVVAMAVWALARRVGGARRWIVYGVGAVPVLVVLFFFFAHVSPLLPASF